VNAQNLSTEVKVTRLVDVRLFKCTQKKFILKLLQHHNCDAVLIGMANKTLTYSELMSTQMRVLFKIEFEKNQ